MRTVLHSHNTARPTAVAGEFYPKDAAELRALVVSFLHAVKPRGSVAPKAIIVPHASLIYSGPIAASAYAQLALDRTVIRRVVLIGPSHRVAFSGVAVSSASEFATPLGDVPVDMDAASRLCALPRVCVLDDAHRLEHSLEVQLPFLQMILPDFQIIPLVTGKIDADAVARVINVLWDGTETRFVISSDLSHYRAYDTACAMDEATSRAVEECRPDDIGPDQACGHCAVRGLLCAMRAHGLPGRAIDLRNSGDITHTHGKVVGYGAFVFAEAQSAQSPAVATAGDCLEAIRCD